MIGSASEHLLQLVLQDNFTGSQASLNIDLTSNKKERETERETDKHTESRERNRDGQSERKQKQ